MQEVWARSIAEFDRGGYLEYRIPGIVVTERGTLLCCCEARMDTRSDWGRIDVLLLRSADDGATWSRQVVRVPGEDMMNNPTLIVDGDRVLMLLHTRYARAYCMQSVDDGCTWSAPWEITQAYRGFDYPWNVCATGPGHGIATREGRLIAPVWLANGRETRPGEIEHHPSVAGTVYSDDHGRTWHAGARTDGMKDANETALAQLPDGRVLLNFRNCETDYCRRLGLTDATGASLEKIWRCDDLPDPWCFGGMAARADGAILFVNCESGAANPENVRARINLKIKISCDGGESWQTAAHVDLRGGYADIAVRGMDIYVLYEVGDPDRGCIAQLMLKKYRMDAV